MGKRDIAVRLVNTPGLGPIIRRLRLWRGVLVLNYHRIGTSQGSLLDWDLWSSTAEEFDRQVAYVKRNFDVIGPGDLERISGDRTGRYVMITFDDGYRDNYEVAFPILRSHRLTATFFITTGFLDDRYMAWWDEIAWMVRQSPKSRLEAGRWHSALISFDDPDRCAAIRTLLDTYKRLGAGETQAYLDDVATATESGRAPRSEVADLWMTWDMVREMRAAGMTIGGHTVTHPVLARLDGEAQSTEIGECKSRIESELGETISAFSYPVGGRDAFDDRTRAALRRHGFRWAFSYYGGYRPKDGDDLNVPRTAIERDILLPEFTAVTSLPQVFA